MVKRDVFPSVRGARSNRGGDAKVQWQTPLLTVLAPRANNTSDNALSACSGQPDERFASVYFFFHWRLVSRGPRGLRGKDGRRYPLARGLRFSEDAKTAPAETRSKRTRERKAKTSAEHANHRRRLAAAARASDRECRAG